MVLTLPGTPCAVFTLHNTKVPGVYTLHSKPPNQKLMNRDDALRLIAHCGLYNALG